MKIETHHIPTTGFDLTYKKNAEAFDSLRHLTESSVCEFIAPLKIDLNIIPLKDIIRVKGTLNTRIRQACVRCLGDFTHALRSRFTLNYSKSIPQDLHTKEKEGIELTAQQIGTIFYDGDEIDFTDAVQEQVVLAIPYKPICSDDCKGLCAQCGNDLNKDTCQCDAKDEDGPFAALKKLKLPSQ